MNIEQILVVNVGFDLLDMLLVFGQIVEKSLRKLGQFFKRKLSINFFDQWIQPDGDFSDSLIFA